MKARYEFGLLWAVMPQFGTGENNQLVEAK